jgi:GPI mannosyltransferase 1 subunit M
MKFLNSLVIGFLLRVSIVYFINYTDIDYLVYTDGAKYVLQGGSPYDRHTYRYTPLVAYMSIPNILVHELFGKMLFIFVDLYMGYLIKKILSLTTHLSE